MTTPTFLSTFNADASSAGLSFLESTSFPDMTSSSKKRNSTLKQLDISPVRDLQSQMLDDNGNPIEVRRELEANRTYDIGENLGLPGSNFSVEDLFESSIDSLAHRVHTFLKTSKTQDDSGRKEGEQPPQAKRLTFKEPIEEVKTITPATGTPVISFSYSTISTLDQSNNNNQPISFSVSQDFEQNREDTLISNEASSNENPAQKPLRNSRVDPYDLLNQVNVILNQIKLVKGDTSPSTFSGSKNNNSANSSSSRAVIDGSSMFAKSSSVETIKSRESISFKSTNSIPQVFPTVSDKQIIEMQADEESDSATVSDKQIIEMPADEESDSDQTEYLPIEELGVKYSNLNKTFQTHFESLKSELSKAKHSKAPEVLESKVNKFAHSRTKPTPISSIFSDSDTNQVSGSVVSDETLDSDFFELLERQKLQLRVIEKQLAHFELKYRKSKKAKAKEKHTKRKPQSDGSEETGMENESIACAGLPPSCHGDRKHCHQRTKELYCQHNQLGRQLSRFQSNPLLVPPRGHRSHRTCPKKMTDDEDDQLCYHLQRLGRDFNQNFICNYEDLIEFDRNRRRRYQPYQQQQHAKIVDRSVQTSIIVDTPRLDTSPRNLYRTPEVEVIQERRTPVSWFFPIDAPIAQTARKSTSHPKYDHETIPKSRASRSNLQEAFEKNCNRFQLRSQRRIGRIRDNASLRVSTADQRRREISETYLMSRQLEDQQKRNTTKIKKKGSPNGNFEQFDRPRPLPLTTRRVFTHRQMREQTEKLYRTLPEVKAKNCGYRREDDARRRRMMAEVFTNKLKEAAIKGIVNWPITGQAIQT